MGALWVSRVALVVGYECLRVVWGPLRAILSTLGDRHSVSSKRPSQKDIGLILSFMVNNIPSKIEKLSLSGNDDINDNHVKTLVERCTNLKVLNLSFTEITEKSLNYISENLKLLEVLHM